MQFVQVLGYGRAHRLGTCFLTQAPTGTKSLVVASWNTQTGGLVDQPVTLPTDEEDAKAGCWALAPDGQLLAQGYDDHTVLYDLTSGKPVRRLKGQSRPYFLDFSADGQSLVACSYQSNNVPKESVAVWDIATGQLRLAQPLEEIGGAVALSSDGRWLATAMNGPFPWKGGPRSFRIQLWETASGLSGPRLQADKGMTSLEFAPDSRVLAAGYTDGAVRLWEMSTLQERCCFKGHRGYVGALAFSSDGSRLASGSGDTTALIWEVPPLSRPAPAREDSPKPEALWEALGKPDAADAYRALCLLEQTPERTLPLLRRRLQPVVPDAKQVTRWLADLDAERFEVRRQAFAELEKCGPAVEPVLRPALAGQPSPEARRQIEDLLARLDSRCSPFHLAAVRGVEVLERIGSREARQLLEELAKSRSEHPVVREAQAALKRLDRQPKQ